MKIEIEKLSPSVFLDPAGDVDCILYTKGKTGEVLYGWFTDSLYDYYSTTGWKTTAADESTFKNSIYGIPGEFLE